VVPNVLIRDVPADDLALIRATAADQGVSLQSYLRETVSGQADYLRRREALAAMGRRLADSPGVPESERSAVLGAIADEQAERARQLGRATS
jgi:hypothetical protein